MDGWAGWGSATRASDERTVQLKLQKVQKGLSGTTKFKYRITDGAHSIQEPTGKVPAARVTSCPAHLSGLDRSREVESIISRHGVLIVGKVLRKSQGVRISKALAMVHRYCTSGGAVSVGAVMLPR
eukprot:scaffold39683_cov270-Skeletonema_marinoi.AAC.1